MSRFSDLFQEPAPAPEPAPEPVKVEEVVAEKPAPTPKVAKKKFTMSWSDHFLNRHMGHLIAPFLLL